MNAGTTHDPDQMIGHTVIEAVKKDGSVRHCGMFATDLLIEDNI
ncbi:MAG: hypothetical protein ACLUOI_17385 [Eisenbergiella sp.]